MRKFGNALVGLTLLAASASTAEPPRTVGDFSTRMNAVAEKLDLQLAERQRAADSAGAQRLALVAAMIRRASAELRAAEQEHIVDDADVLPAAIKARLDDAFALTFEAERRAAPEPRFVDEAQAAFNALIDALPVNTPHPTFFGLLSNDLTEPQGRLAADVVVYGHRLIDPLYGEAPGVQFAAAELPASALKTTAERIEIMLPAAVKAAAHFEPSPCEPRPSFGLRVHGVYAKAHGFWPLVWHTRVETNADIYALASPILFEAHIEAAVEAQATQAATQEFRARSEFAVADCEQTRTVQVEVAAPEGASDIDCKAAWTDAAGQTATTGQCERHGGVLRAKGVLTGLAKVCSPDKLCACSAHSQGVLEMSGHFRVSRTATEWVAAPALAPLALPAGGIVQSPLNIDGLRHLTLDVRRRNCPASLDTLEMTLGPDQSGSAISRIGAFRATYRDGRLKFGGAEAMALEGG